LSINDEYLKNKSDSKSKGIIIDVKFESANMGKMAGTGVEGIGKEIIFIES